MHSSVLGQRLNWLPSGVLGAIDGVVSTAGLVTGVVAATPEPVAILTAGLAGRGGGVDGTGRVRLGEQPT